MPAPRSDHSAPSKVLEARGLWRSFASPAGVIHAVRDVNLTLYAGDYVAFVGPSGSGKSTFLGVMGLLDRPTQGALFIADTPTQSLSDAERATLRNQSIGFVFQQFNLLSRKSALQNVELALVYARVDAATRTRRAQEALVRVGLGARMHHRPLALSGGQQQRVAIARALVTNPKLLLADEPTGALDQATAQQLLALFKELNNQGVTIVLVTHDQHVAAQAKRCFLCTDGRIHEQGGPIQPGNPDTSSMQPFDMGPLSTNFEPAAAVQC
jgi:putative ABC transport system ATP-binding protein